MSLAAIEIVREEIERRKSNMDNIHCAHDMLDTLEARIVDRISKELVEIPEETIKEKYSSLHVSEIPKCQYCPMTAEFEGWANKRDPFTQEKMGMMQRIFVCGEHKDQLNGSES